MNDEPMNDTSSENGSGLTEGEGAPPESTSEEGKTTQYAPEPSPGENDIEEGQTSIERAERATEMAAPEETNVPLEFRSDELAHHLAEASEEDLDKADFGIIRLDGGGAIQFYNKFEQRLSGYSPGDTIGKSFFEEIAPCTDSERFAGKFFAGFEEGELDEMFTYTFTYRMEPLIVTIRLLKDVDDEYYVLVDAMR
jgi:photoactive yellow protein